MKDNSIEVGGIINLATNKNTLILNNTFISINFVNFKYNNIRTIKINGKKSEYIHFVGDEVRLDDLTKEIILKIAKYNNKLKLLGFDPILSLLTCKEHKTKVQFTLNNKNIPNELIIPDYVTHISIWKVPDNLYRIILCDNINLFISYENTEHIEFKNLNNISGIESNNNILVGQLKTQKTIEFSSLIKPIYLNIFKNTNNIIFKDSCKINEIFAINTYNKLENIVLNSKISKINSVKELVNIYFNNMGSKHKVVKVYTPLNELVINKKEYKMTDDICIYADSIMVVIHISEEERNRIIGRISNEI